MTSEATTWELWSAAGRRNRPLVLNNEKRDEISWAETHATGTGGLRF